MIYQYSLLLYERFKFIYFITGRRLLPPTPPPPPPHWHSPSPPLSASVSTLSAASASSSEFGDVVTLVPNSMTTYNLTCPRTVRPFSQIPLHVLSRHLSYSLPSPLPPSSPQRRPSTK